MIYRKLLFLSFVIGLMLLSFSGIGSAKDKSVQSRWTVEPLKVDGLDLEWTAEALTPEEDMKVSYGFRNDGKDLYLVFVFNDPKYLSSIDATGMTVYFNAEGKKKKDNGIIFRARRVTPQELIAVWEKEGQTLSEERKKELLVRPYYIVYESNVINKNPDKSAPAATEASLSQPPFFRNALKDKVAVYEFRIPLSRTGQPGGIGAAPGAAVKLGFEWGGMTEDMRKAMMARRAAMGSQAVSMDTSMESSIRDGDEGADAGREGPSGFARGPKKYSFWIDLKLAAAQGGL
ncbi:MAG: hypothetical protein MUQ00_13110 [Candidatus Aminicenantes bacterium]|nr:hypothetical protein [Candidatus Aminicenantes bacterium]